MRRFIASATFAVTTLAASAALPCGGGFGAGLEVNPSQEIVVVHDQGRETYIFSPHFCGKSAEFGLVLPIPDVLFANPTLAEEALFTELDELTAPRIEYVDVCMNSDSSGSGPGSGGGSGAADAGSGVDVVNRGQVGIFDWALLKADSTAAFTDWLDANGFPYEPAAIAHFSHYVTQDWHFVAFKVTVDQNDPPAGYDLCGALGPISLTFPSVAPVIPARIAAVGGSGDRPFVWDIFALGDGSMTARTPGVTTELKYTNGLTADQLASRPELAKITAPGSKLTKLRLTFKNSIEEDITLEPSSSPTFYQETTYVTRSVTCDEDSGLFGCSMSSPGPVNGTLAYGLAFGALALLMRRRRSS